MSTRRVAFKVQAKLSFHKSKPSLQKSNAAGYGKRQSRKTNNDVYEYEPEKNRRSNVQLELSREEAKGYGVGSDGEIGDGIDREALRAQLIGEYEDGEVIGSEDDEEIVSDDDEEIVGDDDDEIVSDAALDNLGSFITSLETGDKKRKTRPDGEPAPSDSPKRKKRQLITERTEAGAENEFRAVNSGSKLQLEDLLAPLASQPSALQSFKKTTKTLTSTSAKSGRILSAPLPQRTQERLDREAAYEQTKKEVDKWKDTMKCIREAEHLSFPLQDSNNTGRTSNLELAAKFKPSNELESSIDALLKSANMRDESDLAHTEDHNLKANKVTLEEVAQRRAEILKMRDLMFRAELKARRINKIKSKAYRRLKRRDKERVSQLSREAGSDEEEGEEEQLEMERKRAMERATLRHKHTGKWAKQMKTRGDNLGGDERREMEEMLARGEKLRRKIHGVGSDQSDYSDDGSDDDERDEESAPQNVWLTRPDAVEATSKASRKNEVVISKDSKAPEKSKNKLRKLARKRMEVKEKAKDDATLEIETEKPLTLTASATALSEVKTSESSGNSKRQDKRQHAAAALAEGQDGDDASGDSDANSEIEAQERALAVKNKGAKAFQQRDLVALAFAGDNVMQQFEETKRRETAADAPKAVDTTIPGWGSWGGVGVRKLPPKPSRIKTIPGIDPATRADYNKKHIIISERRDKKAAKYTAKDLPFPYTSKAQFERSMERPLGTEWNTRVGFQRATLPRVVTKPGVVIAPLKKFS